MSKTEKICDHQVSIDDACKRKYHCGHSARESGSNCGMIIIQCHSEGVMWKGIIPLILSHKVDAEKQNMQDFSLSENCEENESIFMAPNRALAILLNHFHNFIRHVPDAFDFCCDVSTDDFYWYSVIEPPACDPRRSFKQLTKQHNRYKSHRGGSNRNPNILVLLLPPNTPLHHQHYESTIYSRTPSTAPINPFATRLIWNENNFIRLTSLSAYFSTLGGGFFLCRYLSTAIFMARQQCAMALMRGDLTMALKCRINEGYCYIHGGKVKRGKKMIRLVLRDAIQMQLEKEGVINNTNDQHPPDGELSELAIITNMCHSALRFASLINKTSLTGVGSKRERVEIDSADETYYHVGDKDVKHHAIRISSTHDDFQRIRIVKDRKWKH